MLFAELHKFSKNIGTAVKFLVPEGWHEARSLLRTCRSGVTLDHTVICCSVFSLCELKHIFVCKGRNISHCTENIRYHYVKSGDPCNQVAGIFAPLCCVWALTMSTPLQFYLSRCICKCKSKWVTRRSLSVTFDWARAVLLHSYFHVLLHFE